MMDSQKKFGSNINIYLFIIFLAVTLFLKFFIKNDFLHYVFFSLMIWSSLAIAWNIIGGYAGQLHFGMSMFFGIGCYTSALFVLNTNVSAILPLLVAGLICGVCSYFIGKICFRLQGAYFLIVTLAFSQLMSTLFRNFRGITGGSMGLSLNPNKVLTLDQLFFISLLLFSGAFIINYFVHNSRFGLKLIAIKNNQDAAESIGINILKYKNIAHFIASFIAGTTGAIYVQRTLFVEPAAAFNFDISISLVLMVLVGGIATIWGPFLGALIYIVIRNTLIANFPNMHLMIFGFLLIIVVLNLPEGVIKLVKILGSNIKKNRKEVL